MQDVYFHTVLVGSINITVLCLYCVINCVINCDTAVQPVSDVLNKTKAQIWLSCSFTYATLHKHLNSVDVILRARFSAGCLFPLFNRLHFLLRLGAGILFEICIYHFSATHAALPVPSTSCCPQHRHHLQQDVSAYGQTSKVHTVPLISPAPKEYKHTPLKTMQKFWITWEFVSHVHLNVCLWIYHHRPEWNQRAHESVCTLEFWNLASQTAAPAEAKDNPVDYWHCEKILVRFHNTYNPQQHLNDRLPLRRTAVLISPTHPQGKYFSVWKRVQKRVNSPSI